MAEKKKKIQNKQDKVELAYEILAAHEQDLASLDKKVEVMSLLVDKLKGRMGL